MENKALELAKEFIAAGGLKRKFNQGEIILLAEAVISLSEDKEKLTEENEFQKEEIEAYGQCAEKFGDLSNCYDAEDACSLILQVHEEQSQALKEALDVIKLVLKSWKEGHDVISGMQRAREFIAKHEGEEKE